ncbi:MAG: agmatinase family protein [Proteobacteria bacterium]|nr:agmatinase family protein [Pseudomonadota bacterium]
MSCELFGLPHQPHDAAVAILPVPFDATTSYRPGTEKAPDAIKRASVQVDLWDSESGDGWKAGIALWKVDEHLSTLNRRCRADVELTRDPAQVGFDNAVCEGAIGRVNRAGQELNSLVSAFTAARMDVGQIPAVLGGDHSVPLGAIQEASRRVPGLGVLQIDAHADLRQAYEGFVWSHASLMHNVLSLCQVDQIVQVGVRDQSPEERERALLDKRVVQWLDQAMASDLAHGRSWHTIVEAIVAPLPRDVWISFDIDGLDPSLCPNTGTPVPGGLSWREALVLLEVLGKSGRRIVGFDICEVGGAEWDAIVGSRLLFKLAGWSIFTKTRVLD